MESLYESIGSIIPDNLITSTKFPIVTKDITLLKNQGVLARGTVLGIVTASKLAVIVNSANTDGSQAAKYILADEVDTGTEAAENTPATVYETGIFNSNALTFGGTDTADTHEATLRSLSIFLRKNITY